MSPKRILSCPCNHLFSIIRHFHSFKSIFLPLFFLVNGTFRIHCEEGLILSAVVIKLIQWQTCTGHILCEGDSTPIHKTHNQRQEWTSIFPYSPRDSHGSRQSSPERQHSLKCCGNLLSFVLFILARVNSSPSIADTFDQGFWKQNERDGEKKLVESCQWFSEFPSFLAGFNFHLNSCLVWETDIPKVIRVSM